MKALKLFWTIACLVMAASVCTQPSVVKNESFDKLRSSTEKLNVDFPDSALIFAKKLLEMANSGTSDQAKAEAFCTMARVKLKLALPDEALDYNEQSYTINNKIQNETGIAENCINYGSIYTYKANYPEATKYFLRAIEIAEKKGLNKLQQKALLGLTRISLGQKKNDEALKYVLQSVEIEKKFPDEDKRAENFVSLATVYSFRKEPEMAKKYFDIAYAIYEKNNLQYPMAHILVEYSNIYYEQDSVLKAAEIQLKAKKILDIVAPNSLTSAYNMMYMAENYFEIAQSDSLIQEINGEGIPKTKAALLDTAQVYYKLCLEKTKTTNASVFLTASGLLSDLQAFRGDYKSAYQNLQYKFKFNDSLFSQKNKNAIAKLESEKEVFLLTNENQKKTTLNKILIGSACALLIIGFLGYRNFKNRQQLQQAKISELEKDKQLMAVDAMLQGQEAERSRIAKDLHDGLGGMLSGVKLSFVNMKENMVMNPESVTAFENSILQLDATISELRKVAHNLMPEALVKFGLKNALLDYCNTMQLSSKVSIGYEQLGAERELGNTADLNIYRIVQELISNAIKHGNPTKIMVQLTKTNNKILITVEDDGKGFNKSQATEKDGMGIKSVQQRVDYFKGNMDIDTAAGNGTSINIELYI